MVSWQLFLAGTALCCGLPAAGAAEVPRYDARTFFETTSYAGASFSADEARVLLNSDAGGVFNAYSQPVAGGAAVGDSAAGAARRYRTGCSAGSRTRLVPASSCFARPRSRTSSPSSRTPWRPRRPRRLRRLPALTAWVLQA